jgi:alcohol dehydrogenase class IV
VTAVVHQAASPRVVFGRGTIDRLRAEVARLGGTRVLLVVSPTAAREGKRALDLVADLLVGHFTGARTPTPRDVADEVVLLVKIQAVDCVVVVGGATTISLAKTVSVRTGVPQVVVPTTYAGSEVSPVLPDTVVYDVDLTLATPVDFSVASAATALGHAVEALYSPVANPITDSMALEAIAGIARALPVIVRNPCDIEARTTLLGSAWLAGTCLATAGTGLHHRLCRALGGLPRAQTHAVVLPHAMAHNARAAPKAMRRIADALGVPDAPRGVADLLAKAGAPTSLRELGMAEADVERAVALGVARAYQDPEQVTADGLRGVLHDAWRGTWP